MQRRKFLVPIIALLLVGVAIPVSVPRAHGDDNYGGPSLTISGFLFRNQPDAYLGSYYYQTFDAVQAGNTLTFNALFTANSYVYQRNLTMGIKFDWMTNYQNTTGGYTAVFAGQTVTLSLSYTIPALTGQYANLNQASHTWTIEVWDMPVGATWKGACYDNNPSTAPFYPMCNSLSNTCTFICYGATWHPVAIYNSAQAGSYTTKLQANAILTSLKAAFSNTSPPPGSSAALAMYSQGNTQLALGDAAYSNGDFTTAQTDYQNALNDANSAQSSLSTIGGGTDTATFTSIWIDSVAILLGGIGAALVGFAGFKYLRGKTRALQGYTPPTLKA